MKIGTPLAANATKVMLLGSGELGKEVIIALQRLGVETIAVDRYENAPGHQVAHRSYTIDMSDRQQLRTLIENERPSIVIPEIEAIATDVLVEIEAEGLTEVIPTARATQLTMNREGIRLLASEQLGLPTSKFAFAETLEELQSSMATGLTFPCFIKPVMSSSGKGQSLVNNNAELEQAWEHAMQAGRVKKTKVIIEEKIDFDYEITLLTVRYLNEHGELVTEFCQPIGHVQQQGDYVESWQPQAMSNTALNKAQDIAFKITSELGGRGLFGVELFVKGDEVWFSEVSPRPHDTGMVTMATQRQSEFEIHARAVLGLPISVELVEKGASAVIYGAHDNAVISYSGIEQALSGKQVDLRLFGKPLSFSRRRMGVALAWSENVEDARNLAKEAAGKVVTEGN